MNILVIIENINMNKLEKIMLNWSDTKPKNKELENFLKKKCAKICSKQTNRA